MVLTPMLEGEDQPVAYFLCMLLIVTSYDVLLSAYGN